MNDLHQFRRLSVNKEQKETKPVTRLPIHFQTHIGIIMCAIRVGRVECSIRRAGAYSGARQGRITGNLTPPPKLGPFPPCCINNQHDFKGWG